jgi:hypothetical protein
VKINYDPDPYFDHFEKLAIFSVDCQVRMNTIDQKCFQNWHCLVIRFYFIASVV